MKQVSRSKTRISITIVPLMNILLEKVSQQSGISKSSLIEKAVGEFLQKKLDEDTKSLSKLTFEDLPTEDQWMTLQSSSES